MASTIANSLLTTIGSRRQHVRRELG